MSGSYIYGIHEPPPLDWLDTHMVYNGSPAGWIVHTHELGTEGHHGFDYTPWTGYGNIARLNYGYSPHGTIPVPSLWAQFALRCADWAGNSSGCNHWIVGNEPNSSVEWPNGYILTSQDYVQCFQLCYAAIKSVQPDSIILPAAIAPWNAETHDWLCWYEEIAVQLYMVGMLDGLCWHTYTHGSTPDLITSMGTMGFPFEDRLYQFRAYLDFWDKTPEYMRDLPVFITETDQGDIGGVRNPWLNEPNTWVQEAYREIDRFNRTNGYPVKCLALYRWPQYDEWYIDGKVYVYDDFSLAVAEGYHNNKETDVDEWVEVWRNNLDLPKGASFYDQDGQSEVTIPKGFRVAWEGVRPEMDVKDSTQGHPEVWSEPYSGVGFHVFTTFSWQLYSEEPIIVTPGLLTVFNAGVMIVANGIDGDFSKVGDCGMRIGIQDPIDGDSVDMIVWGEWYSVREGEGEERKWILLETPEIVPASNGVIVWIQCNNNLATAIAAGHYDNLVVWQKQGVVPPLPPNDDAELLTAHAIQLRLIADDLDAIAGRMDGGNNELVCALARQIVDLTCVPEIA